MLRLPHIATLTALALLLAACSPAGDPPATESASPSPSAEEPLFATEEEAVAAADDLLQRYWAATDTVYQSGGHGVELLEPLVTDQRMSGERTTVEVFQRGTFVQVGNHSTDSTRFEQIKNADGVTALVVTTCVDYSQVRAFNSAGAEAERKNWATRLLHEVTLHVDAGLAPPALRLHDSEPWPDSPC